MVLFLEIGRGGGGELLSLTRPHSRMCIKIYIFNFKKQISKKNTNTKKEYKKDKKLKKKIEYLRKIAQIINLRPPGWRFFSSPACPEIRVFFGLTQNDTRFIIGISVLLWFLSSVVFTRQFLHIFRFMVDSFGVVYTFWFCNQETIPKKTHW